MEVDVFIVTPGYRDEEMSEDCEVFDESAAICWRCLHKAPKNLAAEGSQRHRSRHGDIAISPSLCLLRRVLIFDTLALIDDLSEIRGSRYPMYCAYDEREWAADDERARIVWNLEKEEPPRDGCRHNQVM